MAQKNESTCVSHRKYFHQLMQVLSSARESTFNSYRKYFHFLWVFGLNSRDLFYTLDSTQLFDESFGA